MTIFNYTVNYVDLIIIGAVILICWISWHRGILMGVINFVRYSLGTFLCFFFSTNYTMMVYNEFVRPQALQYINDKIATSGNIDEVTKNLNDFGNGLPPFIAQFMDFKQFSITSSDLAESILNGVFQPVLLVLTRIAIFLGVFIIFFGATGIIILIVRGVTRHKEKKAGKKSKLTKTDKAMGLVFGIFKSAVILFAFSSIITYFLSLDDSRIASNAFLTEASNSALLHYINEINPFNAITEGLI